MAKLTEVQRAFLNERRFAVLATMNQDGTPQLTVMWFELRGDTIVMNTSADRVKDANVRRDPRIAICIEDGYRYLTISGTAELEDDHETTQNDIYALARRYNPDFKEGDYPVFATQQRVTILLPIEKVIANGFS
jgi:PPOX class probable F420-dependent enzyme